MMNFHTQIEFDFFLIVRCLVAVLWGILFACFLQFNRHGQYLAKERTWITVTVGIGLDLLLGIGAQWWEIWLIIAGSSLGIIARSLLNEQGNAYTPDIRKYTVQWLLNDAIDNLGNVISALDEALQQSEKAAILAAISRALAAAYSAQRHITQARYGDPKEKK